MEPRCEALRRGALRAEGRAGSRGGRGITRLARERSDRKSGIPAARASEGEALALKP